MKQILCYGDSNTWGYWGNDWTRFPFEDRWPGRLEMLMGKDYRVIEEGLCSRTIVMEDSVQPHRSGLRYLQPCLMSQFPLDYLIVMLGTNDTKRRYGISAQEIGLAMEELLKTVLGFFHWTGARTKFLLIAPAPLQSYEGNFETDGESVFRFPACSPAYAVRAAFRFFTSSKRALQIPLDIHHSHHECVPHLQKICPCPIIRFGASLFQFPGHLQQKVL